MLSIDPSELERKLSSDADFRVLLMVLFHFTGDRAWLDSIESLDQPALENLPNAEISSIQSINDFNSF